MAKSQWSLHRLLAGHQSTERIKQLSSRCLNNTQTGTELTCYSSVKLKPSYQGMWCQNCPWVHFIDSHPTQPPYNKDAVMRQTANFHRAELLLRNAKLHYVCSNVGLHDICFFANLPAHFRLEVCGNGFQYCQSLPFPLGHSHSNSRNLFIVKPIPIPILFPKTHSHSLPFPFPPNHLQIKTFQSKPHNVSFALSSQTTSHTKDHFAATAIRSK